MRRTRRALVDQFGDHRAACARSGLLAKRAPTLERAWVRVAREAVAAEGRVVPQQWLAQTTAPGVAVLRQMTDAGWTSSSMARLGVAKHFAVT